MFVNFFCCGLVELRSEARRRVEAGRRCINVTTAVVFYVGSGEVAWMRVEMNCFFLNL